MSTLTVIKPSAEDTLVPAAGNGPVRLKAPFVRSEIEALVARYGSPLLVIDCDQVRAQYRALSSALPGVDLHYALKPLPELTVVKVLKTEGCFFDLASGGEVDVVRAAGVLPERCIHTHPIKRDSDIRDALRFRVRTFVADNVDELGKFIRHRKRCEVLLRVAFRAPDAIVDLSRKFGCQPELVPELLDVAARLEIKVVGLSFHVGSQVSSASTYVDAIKACGELIKKANESGIAKLHTLDIGGGFPVSYGPVIQPIHEFCAPIRAALSALPPGVRVIAEPGRFIAAPAGTCIATVIGRAVKNGVPWYYLDDGVYGSFSGQMFDHANFPIDSLRSDGERIPSVLAGPTCDSIDVVAENLLLPPLEIGDLIIGRVMGAYSSASATDFNFIRRARVLPVNVTVEIG